jgi:hypothetical protein
LFDWPQVLTGGFLHKARLYLERQEKILIFHDQDALNVAFEGCWTPLESRWNCNPMWLANNIHPFIAHFYGPNKPWQQIRPRSFEVMTGAGKRTWRTHNRWYQKMLSNSPWSGYVSKYTPHRDRPRTRIWLAVLKLWVLWVGLRPTIFAWRRLHRPTLVRSFRLWRIEIGARRRAMLVRQVWQTMQ